MATYQADLLIFLSGHKLNIFCFSFCFTVSWLLILFLWMAVVLVLVSNLCELSATKITIIGPIAADLEVQKAVVLNFGRVKTLASINLSSCIEKKTHAPRR